MPRAPSQLFEERTSALEAMAAEQGIPKAGLISGRLPAPGMSL